MGARRVHGRADRVGGTAIGAFFWRPLQGAEDLQGVELAELGEAVSVRLMGEDARGGSSMLRSYVQWTLDVAEV